MVDHIRAGDVACRPSEAHRTPLFIDIDIIFRVHEIVHVEPVFCRRVDALKDERRIPFHRKNPVDHTLVSVEEHCISRSGIDTKIFVFPLLLYHRDDS